MDQKSFSTYWFFIGDVVKSLVSSSQEPRQIFPTWLPQSSISRPLTDSGRALSVITGSRGGAAPGTSWLTAHLDDFSLHFTVKCKVFNLGGWVLRAPKDEVTFNASLRSKQHKIWTLRVFFFHTSWSAHPLLAMNVFVSRLAACLFTLWFSS